MNKHKKVAIATCVGFTNRGAEALLQTRIKSIKAHYPNVSFYVLAIYLDSCDPIEDVRYIQTFGGQREKFKTPSYLLSSAYSFLIWTIDAIAFRFINRAFSKNIKKLCEVDIFISTDGDVLGEDYGFLPLVWRLYYLSLGLIMKKPVLIYSEGLGPFNSRIAKIAAKIFFKKCVYISVRDEISLKNILDLGITNPPVVDLVADSAFLLEKSTEARLNYKRDGKKLIGVAVSKLAAQYGFSYKGDSSYKSFVIFMAEVIDWLIDYHSSEVILIPHVVQVGRNDYETAEDIIRLVKNKKRIRIVEKDLTASELKAVISYCDLVIASRMHASIAALSTGVPVVGIAYSHKMNGIFRSLKIETVIHIKELGWEITDMISETIEKSSLIKNKIASELVEVMQKADRPGVEVARLLKESK